jgi:hypothetical protein
MRYDPIKASYETLWGTCSLAIELLDKNETTENCDAIAR